LQERQFSLHSEYVNAFTRHVREDIAISIATGGAFSGLPQEEETPNGWIVAKLIVAGYFNATPFIEACYITHRYSCINASWEDVDIIPLSGSPFLSPRCTALENKMHFSYADSLDSANEFIKTYLHQCCILAAEVKHDQIGGDIHIAEITPCAFRWRVPPKNL